MALKILGQVALSAATLTNCYATPTSTESVISSIVICNTSGTNRTFRLSVAIADAGDTPAQYLYYDESLPKDTSFVATIGITLAATDVIRAEANGTGVAVNVFGVEIS